MSVSIPGLLVCGVLLLLGQALGYPVIVALLASLAIGSTAFASLPSLGGSTPLIYTLFAMILIIRLAVRSDCLALIGAELARHPINLVVLFLVIYTFGTAWILPRLFMGETSAFTPVEGEIREFPLAPVSGNITQSAYFALGAITCISLCITLRDVRALLALKRGFFAWVMVNMGLGLVDLLGKTAGAGDLLAPIRTANYAMLTDVEQAGFSRIAGGHPEASAFAMSMFAGTVFVITSWRVTRTPLVLLLALGALSLMLLSTSTTAYVCFALYGAFMGVSALWYLVKGRIRRTDLVLAGIGLTLFTLCLGLYLVQEDAFADVQHLIEVTILTKSQSASAAERGYWNMRSLQTVVETGGLGIGIGSSRASNWLIAVLSQTGVIGTALQLVLVAVLLRPAPRKTHSNLDLLALHEGARAAGLAWLVAATVSAGAADPGIFFFICLATVMSSRDALLAGREATRHRRDVVPTGSEGAKRGEGPQAQDMPARKTTLLPLGYRGRGRLTG